MSQVHGSLRALSRRHVLAQAAAVAVPVLAIAPRRAMANAQRPDAVDATFWTVPRSLAAFNTNTGQSGDILYWADGAYVMEGFVALSRMMYDHHEGKAVQMQPAVFDLAWAAQRWYQMATGKRTWTRFTSGYRTARTNVLVGGAPGGMHPQAAALDGRMDGVDLKTYAVMLLAFNSGGVGLYEHHVHMDVGRPSRFWRGSYRES